MYNSEENGKHGVIRAFNIENISNILLLLLKINFISYHI
jgi:hypothetical protein